MALDQTFYCTFLDKNSQSKFLCYTRSKNGTFKICLTDVSTVWSADCTQDFVDQCVRQMFALRATEEKLLNLRQEAAEAEVLKPWCWGRRSGNVPSLRPACLREHVSVVVDDTSAELCGGPSPGDLRVKLARLEAPQAAEELKELLFTMADSLSESAGASASRSPLKTQLRRSAELDPQQTSAPSGTLKKRAAGTSLINPGAKKKAEAAGVTFDDAED